VEARLRRIRKSQRLSQAEFGARLGVSRNVIANIEGGRVRPSSVFVDHLCSVFLVNKDWLLEGVGDIFAGVNSSVSEALRLFEQLKPEFQEYAVQQMEALRALQDKTMC
jgi:transcriptional regulator with XRE-family HTH domain